MIQGQFHTDFGLVFVTFGGAPTPEQVRDFLPQFETAVNQAVREWHKVEEEARRANAN